MAKDDFIYPVRIGPHFWFYPCRHHVEFVVEGKTGPTRVYKVNRKDLRYHVGPRRAKKAGAKGRR